MPGVVRVAGGLGVLLESSQYQLLLHLGAHCFTDHIEACTNSPSFHQANQRNAM